MRNKHVTSVAVTTGTLISGLRKVPTFSDIVRTVDHSLRLELIGTETVQVQLRVHIAPAVTTCNHTSTKSRLDALHTRPRLSDECPGTCPRILLPWRLGEFESKRMYRLRRPMGKAMQSTKRTRPESVILVDSLAQGDIANAAVFATPCS